MRHIGVLAAVAAVSAAAGVLVSSRVDAARPVPSLDVAFGPVVVEAQSVSRAFLTIRNVGTAASTLGVGDQIDLVYGAGSGATDLAAAGSSLASSSLPAGVMLQALPESRGVRLVVQAGVSVPVGSTVLVPFDFASGEPGVALVTADLRLGKPAGRYARRVETRVAKSPPREDLFYGDGHDGALSVTSDMELPNTGSFSYASVAVASGATLTVPSGATLRCTGTFSNAGTIVVRAGTPGGTVRLEATYDAGAGGLVLDPAKVLTPPIVPTDRADSLAAPSFPALMSADTSSPGLAQAAPGALGGTGLGTRVRRLPLSSFRAGGGGGTGAFGAVGGSGGGLLRVLARGAVSNSGTIRAAGEAPTVVRGGAAGGGAGGGAGGIVILGSAVSVANTGTIDVRGGNAGPQDGYGAGGGPGGGGLVALVAPQITGAGAARVDAGVGYTHSGNVSAYRPVPSQFLPVWAGGGGGGACVGSGGDGHNVGATGVFDGILTPLGQPVPRAEPTDGDVLHVNADPRTAW